MQRKTARMQSLCQLLESCCGRDVGEAQLRMGQWVAVALDKAAQNQDVLLGGDRSFRIAQMAEEVVSITMPKDSSMAAKIGWYLGNRHLPIEVREKEILLESFPTLTDSLDRIGIGYSLREDVLNCRPHSEHTH